MHCTENSIPRQFKLSLRSVVQSHTNVLNSEKYNVVISYVFSSKQISAHLICRIINVY